MAEKQLSGEAKKIHITLWNKLLARRGIVAYLPIIVAIVLLFFGGSWEYFQVHAAVTHYACYALTFWLGGSGVNLYHPLAHCDFLPAATFTLPPFHALPLEYPPLSLAVFSLALFAPLHYYTLAFAVLMALLIIFMYWLLLRHGPRGAALAFATYMVIGAWGIALGRFDLVPAMLTLLCVIAAERKRWTLAYIALAFAFLLKVYPLFFLPALFIAEQAEQQEARRFYKPASLPEELWLTLRDIRHWCWKNTIIFFAIAFAVTGFFALLNFQGAVLSQLSYFANRPVQIESTGSPILFLAAHFGYPVRIVSSFGSTNVVSGLESLVEFFFIGLLVPGYLYALYAQWRGKLDVTQAFIAILLIFIVTSKVFSPQYLMWLIPLLAYSGAYNRFWLIVWVPISLLTTYIFPYIYTNSSRLPVPYKPGFLESVTARNALLAFVTLAYLFNWWQVRSTRDRSANNPTKTFPGYETTLRIITLLPLLYRPYLDAKRKLTRVKQKGSPVKNMLLSLDNVPFVGRLKQLTSALFHFLDWFTPTHPFIADKRARTFLISFTMLFFELLCIRWIPSYVRYLSYFNNFLLLASFLGIGLGMLSARRERFWFPPFPILLGLLVLIIAKTKFQLIINSTQVLYFGLADEQSAAAENFLVLPLIFGMVTLCFIPLSRAFGKLFSQLNPLTAYTYDIVGSLAGIAAFSAISYFSLPPLVWFSILSALLLLLSAKRTVLFAAAVLAATLFEVGQLQAGAYWSPYYKIVLHPAVPDGYIVDVNGIGHQAMTSWQYKEPFYKEVYRIFGNGSFHHALILGAGTGSDTAIALAYGVDSITAVEIDPTIQQLGAQFHPDQPYSNPRVHVVINDGRSFLQNTTDHYDLIIFALPDSLTLTSNNTSLRLESFLLTQDAIATARTHLTNNGVLVMYNFYRQNWLVQKLVDMVGNVFNQQPLVTTYGGAGRAAAIMAGPRLATLPKSEFGTYHEQPPPPGTTDLRIIGQGYYPLTSMTPATDDWPFLYLQDRSFPIIYILGLAMVALYALIGTVTFAPRKTLRRFDWHMFFLGMAFILLEVKSLTTFSLLFGSTWLVNSLVFFAILSSVLLAILVNRRFKFKRISVFYLLLFGVLLLNILVPPNALLLNNPIIRYILASALAFTPVFLANIIFTNSFRDSETADIAFASNLLGIMVGGGMEYFSMLIGYRLLLIPVIVFYACALLLRLRSTRTPGASDEDAATELVPASQ